MQLMGHRQRAGGQAIVEGTAFMMFLVPILVAITLLNIFIVTYGYNQMLLGQIADAAARSAANDMYWLGAPRPTDLDGTAPTTSATNDAASACTNMGSRLHIPVSVSKVDFSDTNSVGVTVQMTPPDTIARFLPAAFKMQATAFEPYMIERPVALLALGLLDSGGANGIQFNIPVYGACTGAGPGGGTPLGGTYSYPLPTPATRFMVNDFYYSSCLLQNLR